MFFLGRYEHSLDDKQRFAIPVEFRELIPQQVQGRVLVAAPGSNKSLWLWPEQTFNEMAVPLTGTLLGHRDVQRLGRSFFSKSARLIIDSAGRVRVPDRLLQQYGIEANVMILGVGNHLEICRPDALAAEEAREAETPEEEEDLWDRAREVLERAERARVSRAERSDAP